MLGILSITSLSFIHNGNAMTSAYVPGVSEVCYYNAETNEPIEGLDNKDYYLVSPRETTDIGNELWEFTNIRSIGDGCYQFVFKGEGSVFIFTYNLPEGYKGPQGYQTIYSSKDYPYPSVGFKIEITEVEEKATRSGEFSSDYAFDISDYLDANVDTNDYGQEIQEYVELAEAYKEMAQDYSDVACDEAEAALAARDEGDYEAFEEHMENSDAAAQAAQDAADEAQYYANTVQDLADTAADGGDTTDGGLGIDFGWYSDAGLGQTYDIEDISDIWSMMPTWSREELMGVYTDPTWGMENIPLGFEYDQYIDPEYWIQDGIIQESYYDENPTDEYYVEANNFYESVLVGDDLDMYQNDAGYHDFLINAYVNTFNETAAYQAAVAESYSQGNLSFEAYETNIQGQVTGYEASALSGLSTDYSMSGVTETSVFETSEMTQMQNTQMMQNIFNFTSY